MINLKPGTHIVVLNKVEGLYRIEADITTKILELQRFTSLVAPNVFQTKLPNPIDGPQKLFAQIIICFGCQTCWRLNEKNEVIDTGPHYLNVANATEFVSKVYEAPIKHLGPYCSQEAVRRVYAEEYNLIKEVLSV